MIVYGIIFYFLMFLTTLLLLAESRPGQKGFIFDTGWALLSALFWPVFWAVVLIGSLYQLIRYEGK